MEDSGVPICDIMELSPSIQSAFHVILTAGGHRLARVVGRMGLAVVAREGFKE